MLVSFKIIMVKQQMLEVYYIYSIRRQSAGFCLTLALHFSMTQNWKQMRSFAGRLYRTTSVIYKSKWIIWSKGNGHYIERLLEEAQNLLFQRKMRQAPSSINTFTFFHLKGQLRFKWKYVSMRVKFSLVYFLSCSVNPLRMGYPLLLQFVLRSNSHWFSLHLFTCRVDNLWGGVDFT